MLAEVVMQIVANPALLALADFQNFLFQPRAFLNLIGQCGRSLLHARFEFLL